MLRSPRKTPRYWVSPCVGLWALAIVLEAWTPPLFVARSRRDLAWEMFIPFLAYYRRTDIYAPGRHHRADDAVPSPRGAPGRAIPGASAWPVVAIGLGVGLMMEAGQFFMENRIPEITDALSGAVGSWLGFALANYAASLIGPAIESRGEARYPMGREDQ